MPASLDDLIDRRVEAERSLNRAIEAREAAIETATRATEHLKETQDAIWRAITIRIGERADGLERAIEHRE